MTLLSLDRVDAFYDNVQVLRQINLHVQEGEILALVGANGAGKTSMLRTVSGVGPTYNGIITFEGEVIDGKSSQQRVEVGLVQIPEGRKLFASLSVADNLQLGAFVPRARKNWETMVEAVYELFPILRERHHQVAGTLSGGQQQMLAIARGLMSNPKLLMLDEPSLGLAPKLILSLLRTLQDIRDRGVTILLVEQNVRQSLSVSDSAYVIENGRIVMEGAAGDLLKQDHIKTAYLGIK